MSSPKLHPYIRRAKSGPRPNYDMVVAIRQCLGRGLSLNATARELCTAYSYVNRLAHRYNMIDPVDPTVIDVDRLREVAAAGLCQADIARVLGATESGVHYALKRHGIAAVKGRGGRKARLRPMGASA